MPPDPGYQGFQQQVGPDIHQTRKYALWGTLMAGGAGVEYYFGYQHPHNDLNCEDWRSRDLSWDYCRYALEFFGQNAIPFWETDNADPLVGNTEHDNSKYCLAKSGEVYLVYLPEGGTTDLDLTGASGDFSVEWFNPRKGGKLHAGSVAQVAGGGRVSLGNPPSTPKQDWVVLVRSARN